MITTLYLPQNPWLCAMYAKSVETTKHLCHSPRIKGASRQVSSFEQGAYFQQKYIQRGMHVFMSLFILSFLRSSLLSSYYFHTHTCTYGLYEYIYRSSWTARLLQKIQRGYWLFFMRYSGLLRIPATSGYNWCMHSATCASSLSRHTSEKVMKLRRRKDTIARRKNMVNYLRSKQMMWRLMVNGN